MVWHPSHRLKEIDKAIWTRQPQARSWKTVALRLARLALVLVRDLTRGQLTLRAMSLVYTTLMSLVPLLALSFSVLKAFGVYNQIGPALHSVLEPLGDKGEEVSQRILQFIENMNVGVLGSVGLALLLYTSVSLMQKIEESFNYIWHVTQPRSMGERFSRYLSVLLIGPILVFSAIGITATVLNSDFVREVVALQPFGYLIYGLGKLMPYVLVIAAFTFIYLFIPNARVRLGPALTGGIVGGILWQSAGWAFAVFVASSTQYAAIYSSFAILILFLIWLYVSWLIVLFGASVAFYQQHPEYLVAQGGEPRLSNRMRERLALAIMSLIAQHYLAARPGWTIQSLTQHLGVPMHAVDAVLDALFRAGLLLQSSNEPPVYLPARDVGALSVHELLQAVRASGEDRFLNPAALAVSPPVEEAFQRFEQGVRASLSGMTVKDLAPVTPTDPAPRPVEIGTQAHRV